MSGCKSLFAGLIVGIALSITGPAAAENVLRFTSQAGGALTFDPHALVDNSTLQATLQVYEFLLDVESDYAVTPQLATAWRLISPTVWELQLRRGVRFHDGTPFTADDVTFSLERARAATSDPFLQERLALVADTRAIDDYTVRVTTTAPDPVLWLKLTRVAIMSRAWARRHGVTVPANFRAAREETFATAHANGTGPFVLREFEPGAGYVLIRNPEWWGTQDYPHNIDRVVHIWDNDQGGHVRKLLAGEIDLLQQPLFEAYDTIRRAPDLKLIVIRKPLTKFFGMDQGSAQLRSSNVKGMNPFKDKRVRQAMYHAIDVEAALRPIMGELLFPAGMVIAPGIIGYSPELDKRLPHDPAKSKALLVEAGYQDGFSVTLDCPSDWGDDELATCRGAASQLGDVGIRVLINFLPTDPLYEKLFKDRQSDFYLDSQYTEPDSEGILRALFHSTGSYNASGYSSPRVDALIEAIGAEMVTYARDAMLEDAWRIVTSDLVYIPVNHSVTAFAMRKNLDLPVDPWDLPRFRQARFIVPRGK
jgi:peptide/nickel transport system substrate-binding protein